MKDSDLLSAWLAESLHFQTFVRAKDNLVVRNAGIQTSLVYEGNTNNTWTNEAIIKIAAGEPQKPLWTPAYKIGQISDNCSINVEIEPSIIRPFKQEFAAQKWQSLIVPSSMKVNNLLHIFALNVYF